MAQKKITHTHIRLELVMLKAALGKYETKVKAAIAALVTAGAGKLASQQAAALMPLVGDVGDRSGSTVAKLDAMIEKLETDDAAAILESTVAEAHAYEVGLPMQAKRLRTIEGELRSFHRDEWAEWAVETANLIDSTLKDHYTEQLPHGDGKDKPDAGPGSKPAIVK